MVDVLEFGPGRIPPVLWDTAVRRLGEGTALPARDKQFIYALVFPRLEEARPESTSDQREIMHGMLTALARAHHVGIINVDLRENHTLYDRSDGSYRLIDWDCTTTVAAAAGQDPLGPRNDSQSCVVDQPAVPVNFWGEALRGKEMTAAPEMLFPWRDGRSAARPACVDALGFLTATAVRFARNLQREWLSLFSRDRHLARWALTRKGFGMQDRSDAAAPAGCRQPEGSTAEHH